MDLLPDSRSFKALAAKHGLSRPEADDLAKKFRSGDFRMAANLCIGAFGEHYPLPRGENSRWFLFSDRAQEALDAFWAEWLSQPSVALRFLDATDNSSPRELENSPLALLMEDAMRRGWPRCAAQIGSILETAPEAQRNACVDFFMDLFYRIGISHDPDKVPAPLTPWRLLWSALGPQAREFAARPQCWSGFFESPAGKAQGSKIVTDDIQHLGQLGAALEVCEEARPMLIEKLSHGPALQVLARILAKRDAQAHANNWRAQGDTVAGLLDAMERWLGWDKPQLAVLRKAAREQHASKNAPWNQTPRLDAWIEARELRGVIAATTTRADVAEQAPEKARARARL